MVNHNLALSLLGVSHQGDPFSPYLLILCFEVLLCLLHKVESNGNITSVPISWGPLQVNNLLFANDSLLFWKANSLEWSRLIHIRKKYESVFGQVPNKEKTSILFGKNTPLEVMHNITAIAGARATRSFEKYFGLLAIVGKVKTKSFQALIKRTWNWISN